MVVWVVVLAAWQRDSVVVEERFSGVTARLIPRERLSSDAQVWVVDESVQQKTTWKMKGERYNEKDISGNGRERKRKRVFLGKGKRGGGKGVYGTCLVVNVWVVVLAAWQRDSVEVEERFSSATARLIPRERLSSDVQVRVVDVSILKQPFKLPFCQASMFRFRLKSG